VSGDFGVRSADFARAIGVYLDLAFAGSGRRPAVPIDWESDPSVETILQAFRSDPSAGLMRRYVLRLGNAWYPNMKLVFQELLVKDRFFFAVDTHDDVPVDRSIVDFDRWIELKQRNRRLRAAIEAAWQEAGVPTFASIVAEIERETPPIPGAGAEDRGQSILVVDDEVRIGEAVAGILRRQGYRVRHVESAEAAVEAVAEMPFDLVVSDLEMAGMSGLDLARRLRSDPATARIPIILATAAPGVRPEDLEGLVDAFLRKPYESGVLLRFAGTFLESGRRGSGACMS
jgi:CheY-like chemotaxis protein